METMTLLHLHPTLEMLAQELRARGILCHVDAAAAQRHFQGVRLLSEGDLQQDMLYILRPEEAADFPGDPYCCVSASMMAGAQLVCPGQSEWTLLQHLLAIFTRYRSWEQQIDSLVYRNARLHELCEIGARILENPMYIHDDWFVVIAMSQELPKVMPLDFILSSSKAFVPDAIVEDFKYDTDYLETYAYRSAQYWPPNGKLPGCLYVNLWDGEVYQGRLLVVEHHRPIQPADYMIAECLTQRCALLLQRQRLGKERSYRGMDDVMFDLLKEGKTDPAEEHQLLQLLGWRKDDKLTCIRIRSQQTGQTLLLEHLLHSDLFRTFPNSYILYGDSSQCIILNLTKSPITLPLLRHALAPLCRDYCLYAGISSPVLGIRELPIAGYQAEIALSQTFRLKNERWVTAFSDCALDHILSNVNTPLDPHHLAAPELQLLQDHDREHGTQYFETLRTYLLLERDIPKTSEALIIHRTTLLYRLKKLQALIQVDLEDPWKRLYLNLSLWILEQERKK